MSNFNKKVYQFLFYIAIAAGISYIFMGNDLIPESAVPSLISFIDDAAIVMGLVYFLSKMKQRLVGGREQKGMGMWGWIISISVISLVLLYIFAPVDLIPDSFPWVGFMDDVATAITGLVILRSVRKKL